MSNIQMLSSIFDYIRKNGTLTNKAQSCWGADRWELNGLVASLQDDGYTQLISWGTRLCCLNTVGENVKFALGTEKDLIILYNGLQKSNQMVE